MKDKLYNLSNLYTITLFNKKKNLYRKSLRKATLTFSELQQKLVNYFLE